jgi:hypothetical protein
VAARVCGGRGHYGNPNGGKVRGVGLSIVSEGLYVARPSGYASEVRPGRAEDNDLGVGARFDARALLLSTIAEVFIRKSEEPVTDDAIYHKSGTTIQVHSTDGRCSE